MKKIWPFIIFFTACYGGVALRAAHAHMTSDQALSFGKFAMRDNNAQYQVVMDVNGNATYDPKILPFDQGMQGIVQLTEFPPNTTITITADDGTVSSLESPGNTFTVTNFTFSPDPAVTNISGNLTLSVGATLVSSGTGIVYDDSLYTGTYTLHTNY